MSDEPHIPPPYIGNWYLYENLGAGFSGSIYRAINVHTGQEVALKLQHNSAECPTNRYERSFYPALQGGVGMPTLWATGVVGQWDYLAIDLLGKSLDSLFRRSGQPVMDLRSVCCIAMQVISRLEFMHSRGVLHRDIQLGNCVVGLPPNNEVIHMIDFGFSKFYIDPVTKKHIPDSNAKRDFIGNYWFSSVNVHCRGRVPSRRDDMEAVALMLIHMLTPNGLPWTRKGVPKNNVAHERLKRKKLEADPEDLCRGLPEEFEEFLRYCRRLKFAERPDYEDWVERFRDLAEDKGYPRSSCFVWPPPDSKPSVRVVSKPKPPRAEAGKVEDILRDLANLQLGERERKILGERNEIVNGVRREQNTSKEGGNQKSEHSHAESQEDVIVISSDGENTNVHAPGRAPAAARMTKAARLATLARAVENATDGPGLSRLVREFVEVLQESRSKNLTKEGFCVLDALRKQMTDPDIVIVPLRTLRPRHSNGAANVQEPAVGTRYAKMNKLYALRQKVGQAGDRDALGKLLREFGECIDSSAGRTVTKDGIGFLEALAGKLRTVH